jgi:MFS family permease
VRHFADLYSLRFSIILGLGYTSVEAQLLTVPVYFVGACATVLIAWLSDRHQTRWPYIIGPFTMAACAFIALLAIPHPRYPGLTYAFLFAIPAGVYPPIIGILSWVVNNLANIFLQAQAPKYWLGYGFCLGILMADIVATLLLRWAYGSLNKKRDQMSEAEVGQLYSEEDLLAMGDKSPLYRYVV